MTLKELANKIGLTEATVQKYEAGNIKSVSAEVLKKIADALDVAPENLTEWERSDYLKYRSDKQGEDEAKVIKMYSRLTRGHKVAVKNLMKNLLEDQEKYISDK
jgi:transcriptional regulator with XRE-family HTH domain